MRKCYAALALALLWAAPSFAARKQEWRNCIGYDLQKKIESCSKLIHDKGEVNRSSAYNYRANAWRNLGIIGAALSDYNEAIRLNPNYSFPYNGRGLTWRAMGNANKSIADFDKSISLNPNYAKVYNNRGDVFRSTGALANSIADFNKAIALEPHYTLAYFN